jgi:hypothetical protein
MSEQVSLVRRVTQMVLRWLREHSFEMLVAGFVSMVATGLGHIAASAAHFMPPWAWWLLLSFYVGSMIVFFSGLTLSPIGREVQMWYWRQRGHSRERAKRVAAKEGSLLAEMGVDAFTQFLSSGIIVESFWTEHCPTRKRATDITTERPERLHFTKPVVRDVREGDLEVSIPCKAGDIVIRRFIAGGFEVDEGPCVDDEVRVEMHFSDDVVERVGKKAAHYAELAERCRKQEELWNQLSLDERRVLNLLLDDVMRDWTPRIVVQSLALELSSKEVRSALDALAHRFLLYIVERDTGEIVVDLAPNIWELVPGKGMRCA